MGDQWITNTFPQESRIRQESKAHIKINTEVKDIGLYFTD